jgi:hypothetical protein
MERNLVDKGVDAAERDVVDDADEADAADDAGGHAADRPGRRRWWIAGGAVTALLVAGGVAFAVTGGDGAGDNGASSNDRTSPSATPRDDLPAPTLDWRLVVGDVPQGFTPQWINAPQLDGGDFEEFDVTQQVQLWAGPDATMEDGPWLATTVQLLDRFERRNFDPTQYVDPSQAVSTRVGSYEGAFIDDAFSGVTQLVFGPVDDGYAVAISFGGIDRAAISRVAAELTIDESDESSAKAVLGPAVGELGVDVAPLADYETNSWGLGGSPVMVMFNGSMNTTTLTYSSDLGGLTLMNEPLIPGLDPLALAEFVLVDAESTTVHGLPAVAGRTEALGFGFDSSAVVWVEGGRSIWVIGSLDTDELVDTAESVREATVDEFDELRGQIEGFQDEGPGFPEQTWLLGSGDLEDSTTWSVEGDIDLEAEEDVIMVCSWSSSPNESSSGCGADTVDIDAPSIQSGPSVGLRAQSPTLIAMVDIDQQGVVLRFTAGDGTVTESPVRVIRDDWPVRVVAMAVEQAGRAELVAADGTVLVEREVTEDDVAIESGDVPAETVVPAAPAGG